MFGADIRVTGLGGVRLRLSICRFESLSNFPPWTHLWLTGRPAAPRPEAAEADAVLEARACAFSLFVEKAQTGELRRKIEDRAQLRMRSARCAY